MGAPPFSMPRARKARGTYARSELLAGRRQGPAGADVLHDGGDERVFALHALLGDLPERRAFALLAARDVGFLDGAVRLQGAAHFIAEPAPLDPRMLPPARRLRAELAIVHGDAAAVP